jgi:hypothetical protein
MGRERLLIEKNDLILLEENDLGLEGRRVGCVDECQSKPVPSVRTLNYF